LFTEFVYLLRIITIYYYFTIYKCIDGLPTTCVGSQKIFIDEALLCKILGDNADPITVNTHKHTQKAKSLAAA